MIDQYIPTLLPDPYGQTDTSSQQSQIPQYTQPNYMNPFEIAKLLRNQQPNMMGNQQTPNWSNPYANYSQLGNTNYGGGSVGGTGIE